MSELPEGVTHAEAYRLMVEGVRRFAGHQVIAFHDAWALCTGLDPQDEGPEEARRLCWLLEELGYELQWVTELGRTRFQHMWVRGSWPIDFGANLSQPITAFVPN